MVTLSKFLELFFLLHCQMYLREIIGLGVVHKLFRLKKRLFSRLKLYVRTYLRKYSKKYRSDISEGNFCFLETPKKLAKFFEGFLSQPLKWVKSKKLRHIIVLICNQRLFNIIRAFIQFLTSPILEARLGAL